MKHEDCAFYKNGFCTALIDRRCANCPFYKTKEQLEQSRDKARARVCKLPNALYFLKKYYGLGIK